MSDRTTAFSTAAERLARWALADRDAERRYKAAREDSAEEAVAMEAWLALDAERDAADAEFRAAVEDIDRLARSYAIELDRDDATRQEDGR